MKITWLGQACFLIETPGFSIITDPYDSQIGLKLPENLRAEVVTASHQHADHNNVSAITGNPISISQSGSVTVKKAVINGIDTFHDANDGRDRGANIIFQFTLDDLTITHLGDLGHVLGADQLRKLKPTDILLIPVGGTYTIAAGEAVKVVDQIKPRIVVPMHFGMPKLAFPLDGVELFIKQIGLKPEASDYLEVDKNSLPASLKVVVLKPHFL